MIRKTPEVYKLERNGQTIKMNKNGVPRLTIYGKISHLLWALERISWYCKDHKMRPKRTNDSKNNYYDSFFYQLTKLEKNQFHNGDDSLIGNDSRYFLCNEIHEMNLPLKPVRAENPSDNDGEALMYYYIYRDTIIVTHGFHNIDLWQEYGKHYIQRDFYELEKRGLVEWYEMGEAYNVKNFREMSWDKNIRPEHKHLPLKVLYTKRRYEATHLLTDEFDTYSDAIFFSKNKDLKKIFK